jgi:hypothetical protein
MAAVSFEGYYTYLLHQDLGFVIPYTGPVARVIGPDATRVRPLIEAALSQREGSISEPVRHFGNSTAQLVVIAGPTTYEVAYLYPATAGASENPTAFRLELVLPGTLSYRDGRPVQYVPAAYGGSRDKTGLTYVELDPGTLITFRFDPAREAAVRRMVDFLRAANVQQGAEASLIDQSMRGSTPYDFAQHQQLRGELFAKVTEPIGWNVRGLFKDNHLEPYGVWRQLRFLEFKLGLRDLIISRLNATLSEIGNRMGFQATIELRGQRTLEEVQQAKDDFRSGRRGLGDLATFAV